MFASSVKIWVVQVLFSIYSCGIKLCKITVIYSLAVVLNMPQSACHAIGKCKEQTVEKRMAIGDC